MDNEELLKRIEDLEAKNEELESRLDSIEQNSCEVDDETCPECGENPCVCDDDTAKADDVPTDDEPGEIDTDDVDKVEELNFDIPNFADVEDEDGEAGGLYDYGSEEEDEDSPYYG